MTIPATPRRSAIVLGGSTSVPFTFKVSAPTDIRVDRQLANSDNVTLVQNSDYTVTLNFDQVSNPGGSVTLLSASPVGSRTVVLGNVDYAQPSQVPNGGSYKAELHENAFDRMVMQIQQLAEVTERTVKVSPASGTNADQLIEDVFVATTGAIAAGATAAAAATTATSAASAAATSAGNASSALTAANTAATNAGTQATNANNSAIAAAASASTAGSVATSAGAAAGTTAGTAAATTQVNSFKSDLALQTGVSNVGAGLAGYKVYSGTTGSVGRTVQQKLDDFVNGEDFGINRFNTAAQNVTGWDAAMTFFNSQQGGTLYLPRGLYSFNATLNLNVDNVRIVGDGPMATILQDTRATGDFIYAGGGSRLYQAIENLGLTCTAGGGKTSGAMFVADFWRRSYMHRVKMTEWYSGINLVGFEQSTLNEVFIVKPANTGGYGINCGTTGVPSAANLNINNCFLRGNNELINDASKAVQGIVLQNCEAVFGVNTDIGQFRDQSLVVSPTTRCANVHFVQCYFDGTMQSDCVLMSGAGIKQQFQFTGCWFNGAGRHSTGAIDCYGLNCGGAGEYYDMNFTGCRFLSCSGALVVISSLWEDFTFTGCVFTNPGLNGSSVQKHGVLLNPPGTVVKWPIFSGCKFQGTPVGAYTIAATGNGSGNNSAGAIISGCFLDQPLSKPTTAFWGSVAATMDAVARVTPTPASGTMTVPATLDYILVSGTSNIDRIHPTYTGHRITLRFQGAMTVNDGTQNVQLNGNYVTANGSLLTLICESNSEWREVSRVTS